jgi:hypothetical protein
MSGPNGYANGSITSPARVAENPASAGLVKALDLPQRLTGDEIKRFTAELEIPFDPRVIEWRVTNTSHDKSRGQVIPYSDQRAYTDRLNALFTPAGWTRRYTIHTSPHFERSKDQKITAKVLVTCELTIFGLGSHCATGEEWADDENAGTSAEAQAFKRACSCFGLGRYLYYFHGVWIDLDQRKQPKGIPPLPKWATPQGWIEGCRPNDGVGATSNRTEADSNQRSMIPEIEAMAELLGRGLYRGLLRDLAKVWNPREIQDTSLQAKVLEHMRSAERGLGRLEAALDKVGHEAMIPILKSHGIASFERIENLQTLKRIVLEVERRADGRS